MNEIVSDAFSTAIISNKMHVAFYLYREYQSSVFGNKDISIGSIIESFKNDLLYRSKIIHLEEKLFILDKFLSYIEYKQGFELIEKLRDLIVEKAEGNFLVYCSNPLKIITILLYLLRKLKFTYPMLLFKVDELSTILNDYAVCIIDNSTHVDEVEDMVLDHMYNGTQIIDMLAYIDNVPILQNSVIDTIVSGLYYGPYERQWFLKHSL